MDVKTLVVHEIPVPKARPRATMARGHAQMYTPKTTADYEKKIAAAWKRQFGDTPMEGPLCVRIHFGLPIPRSAPKKDKEAMLNQEQKPTKKPDLDNLAKAAMDALNGIAYKDDDQIVTLLLKKYYAEIPFIKIRIGPDEKKEEKAS